MLSQNDIIQWIKTSAALIAENKDHLTNLDRAIGDADHGNNMDRGFKKVLTQLDGVKDKDIGSIFKSVGMALISSVGGAAGPLYGTFYMQAANAINAKSNLTNEEVVNLLQSGMNGLITRGRTKPGEKTIIDSLQPAINVLHKNIEAGDDLVKAMQSAVERAEEGVKETIPMVARKGRASYLGERSAGHQDPGATSAYLLLKALLITIESR